LSPIATIGWIQVDCADPDELRRFWGSLLDFSVDPDPAPPAFRPLARPAGGGPGMSFQRVPESKVVKNRVHLDLIVEDIEAATAWVTQHGGRRRSDSDFHENGWRWRTMADPEGNEFCLVPTQER
jgi:predicted enzyme related to lactoylglutathione lyase